MTINTAILAEQLVQAAAGMESYPDRQQMLGLAMIIGSLTGANAKTLIQAIEEHDDAVKSQEKQEGKSGGSVAASVEVAGELEVTRRDGQ